MDASLAPNSADTTPHATPHATPPATPATPATPAPSPTTDEGPESEAELLAHTHLVSWNAKRRAELHLAYREAQFRLGISTTTAETFGRVSGR